MRILVFILFCSGAFPLLARGAVRRGAFQDYHDDVLRRLQLTTDSPASTTASPSQFPLDESNSTATPTMADEGLSSPSPEPTSANETATPAAPSENVTSGAESTPMTEEGLPMTPIPSSTTPPNATEGGGGGQGGKEEDTDQDQFRNRGAAVLAVVGVLLVAMCGYYCAYTGACMKAYRLCQRRVFGRSLLRGYQDLPEEREPARARRARRSVEHRTAPPRQIIGKPRAVHLEMV
ncbi:unnamed protein product [Vitrella brassicaformis CCMP3155]|uniref:Uncharacterized protein n=1 Tax=Vitrella brassicaformis (strain CCMP3155) TaxID=1169540 RepID=A0A0G4GQ57_VITBC|nr:unnamed protein product [Vitrella brassicaformis CCMP3155]|eukprot:CEM32531.1 unnamed protein product [Vitrella brassicaformis CCMP3155]